MPEQPIIGKINVPQPKQSTAAESTKSSEKTPQGIPEKKFDHNKLKKQNTPRYLSTSSNKTVSSGWMSSMTSEKNKNNIQTPQNNGIVTNSRPQPIHKDKTVQNIRNLGTQPSIHTGNMKPNTKTDHSSNTRLGTNTLNKTISESTQLIKTNNTSVQKNPLSVNTSKQNDTHSYQNPLNINTSKTNNKNSYQNPLNINSSKTNNKNSYQNPLNINSSKTNNKHTIQNQVSKLKANTSPVNKNTNRKTTTQTPDKTGNENAIQPSSKINVQLTNAVQSETSVPQTTLSDLVAKVTEAMTMIERSDKNEFVITLNDIKGMEGVQLKVSEFKHATKELNVQFFGLSHDMAHRINTENTSAVLKGMLAEKGFTLQQLQTDVKQNSDNLSQHQNREDNQQEQPKDQNKKRYFSEEENNWI